MSQKFVAAALAIATVQANGKAAAPMADYKQSETVKIEVPAVPYCPDGSSYDPAYGCAYVDYAEPKLECPHPYKLNKKNGSCYTTTYGESSRVCAKGGYLDHRHCITEVTAPVEISCKRGELQKDGCVVKAEPVIVEDEYDELHFDCEEKGFDYDSDSGMCVKEVEVDATLVCEEGFELKRKKCYTVDAVQPECPKGYSRVGAECIAVVVETPTYDCPKGTKSDDKGNCIETVYGSATATCEKGYELAKHGKCEARVLVTAFLDGKKGGVVDVDCKDGSIDKDGNCYQTYTTAPVEVCDSGFAMNKYGKCEMDMVVQPIPDCSWKFELSGDECVRSNTRDLECPKGYDLESAKDSKNPICTTTVKQGATYVCPKGFEMEKGHKGDCVALEVTAPIAYCKKGYDLVKDQCVIPGYVIAGKDKVYDIDVDCPKGYKLDDDAQMCVDYVKEDAIDVCDKGYTLDSKFGRCSATHEVPAQLMCPKDYQHSSKGGNLCEKVSYDRPVFRCPEGASDHGKSCYIESMEKSEVVLAAPTGKKLRR